MKKTEPLSQNGITFLYLCSMKQKNKYMRTKRLERLIIEDIHPLTIINDRYGGVYSGGAYLAFKLEPWDVPKGVDGSDIECATFWDEDAKEYTVGKGGSPA